MEQDEPDDTGGSHLLRIHFDWRDLENVRIAQQPDPLWELMCAVCRLQTRQGQVEFGHWRRETGLRLSRDRRASHALGTLRTVVPASGYIPDFLTPPVTGECLEAGLEQVQATPRDRLTAELTRFAAGRPVPGWMRGPHEPVASSLRLVSDALRASFRTLLEPCWRHVRSAVGDDLSGRTRAVLDGGTAALLNSLQPYARWNPPYLDVDYPVDRELRLEGRGLTLVPSYFCWRRPTALADPALDPVLVYPVRKQPLDLARAGEERLDRLLGRTRSAVLVDVAGHPTRTTTEVARALELAPASASYQIGVLRGAGLIVSRRDGKHVEHTATSLALNLLAGTGTTFRRGATA
ncbi:DNA-binding transcriptional ArsR family regulator [Streptomyces sp. SAI-117]|uniref:ArsR/SmtB family transcription factor n=1 Tax=Streptomyces sp. SAI-117 TaxID=2940546 RepID=UPI00247691C3|nr:helix-turn-helix domain-containing protein [Streptomyces sp. SAI-117]MDH6565610.1 DNA-binding transcriptional ArsR family regulator [Streptomyces sp. SAI-117]